MTSLGELLLLSDGLTTVRIERWVARGLLRPSGAVDDWLFEEIDVARVRLLNELAGDVGLDDDTLEVVVGLIDQVNTLRGRLDLLAQAIGEQSAETREAIAAALRRLDSR